MEIKGIKKPNEMEITTIKVNEIIRTVEVPNFIKVDVSVLDQDKIISQLSQLVVQILKKSLEGANLNSLLESVLTNVIKESTKTLEIKDVKLIPVEVDKPTFNKIDVTELIKEQIKILINK